MCDGERWEGDDGMVCESEGVGGMCKGEWIVYEGDGKVCEGDDGMV